jgi:hypothetical protein
VPINIINNEVEEEGSPTLFITKYRIQTTKKKPWWFWMRKRKHGIDNTKFRNGFQ